jgi:hypothetical protein
LRWFSSAFFSRSYCACLRETSHRSSVTNPARRPIGSQPGVGVVDAQVQAELRARGEHAIRLVGALGDEVVDQDSGVAFERPTITGSRRQSRTRR